MNTARTKPASLRAGMQAELGRGRRRRIVVIDEDSGFVSVLAKRLAWHGWEHQVLSASISVQELAAMKFEALVVDPIVLGATRWEWLQRACADPPHRPVVVVTGASSVAERVLALRLGVEGWLGKPCHSEELIARIEAILRHRDRPSALELEPCTLGEVEIHDRYQVLVAGSVLPLTRREFQLLAVLIDAGGAVVDRDLIYERVWGGMLRRDDRSVDVFVHKLRRKLATYSPTWRYIHTHSGLGYRFAAQPIDQLARQMREMKPPRETAPTARDSPVVAARMAA